MGKRKLKRYHHVVAGPLSLPQSRSLLSIECINQHSLFTYQILPQSTPPDGMISTTAHKITTAIETLIQVAPLEDTTAYRKLRALPVMVDLCKQTPVDKGFFRRIY